jgi:pimeloyl-ACP methyl ester carboxylesterase
MDKRLRRALALVLCALAAGPGAVEGAAQEPAGAASYEKLEAALTFLRARNARDYAIASPPGIDEGRYVEIGGLQQWITIRGEDRRNPVLLFLHGGPGDATNPWGYAAFGSWLRHYTVVQWDQRGAGRTLARNGSASAATVNVERMARDGIELAEWLRTSQGQAKIVLVGHSFGSILGARMAKARPDLFHAFVGTGQVADPLRNYTVAHGALLARARAAGPPAAVRELEEVGPPPYADGRGYAVQRKWSNRFEGADVFLASTFGLALAAPGSSLADTNAWFEGQMLSAERLVPETSALEPKALSGRFALPVFVIQGAEDFTTPTSLARAFVDQIQAPRKGFVTLRGGGHFAVFMRPEEFRHALDARLRPLLAR